MRARAKEEEANVRREERRLAAMTEQEAKRKKMLEEQQELERIGLEAEVVVRTECLPWCECARWHLCFVPLSCVLLWARRKEPSSKVDGGDLCVWPCTCVMTMPRGLTVCSHPAQALGARRATAST